LRTLKGAATIEILEIGFIGPPLQVAIVWQPTPVQMRLPSGGVPTGKGSRYELMGFTESLHQEKSNHHPNTFLSKL